MLREIGTGRRGAPTGKARETFASVGVDAINAACPMPTRIRETLIDVKLAVSARSARTATALVPVDQILTRPAMAARVAFALVDLVLAQESSVTRVAIAAEGIGAIHADAIVAW